MTATKICTSWRARPAVGALSDVLGRPARWASVGDAPHNLIWPNGEDGFRHRKGACPAGGPTGHGPFGYTGEPVLIPGSMGDASWVLAGTGDEAVLAHARRVREEAPRAYKPVGPVVEAVVAAGAARKVARMWPLLTVKG